MPHHALLPPNNLSETRQEPHERSHQVAPLQPLHHLDRHQCFYPASFTGENSERCHKWISAITQRDENTRTCQTNVHSFLFSSVSSSSWWNPDHLRLLLVNSFCVKNNQSSNRPKIILVKYPSGQHSQCYLRTTNSLIDVKQNLLLFKRWKYIYVNMPR